jgi:serine/threonine protein kinase
MKEESGEGAAGTKNSAKITIKDFDIQGVLGEGSFGKVYCGIHKITGKTYAIKILDKYHITKVANFLLAFSPFSHSTIR